MCAYKDTHAKNTHSSMPINLFRKIIDEFTGLGVLRSVALSLQCEPLLDKELCHKIEYIKKKDINIKCSISTNGILLTSEKLQELCNCGLDGLGISLNAVNETTFSLVCGVNGYNQFMKNLFYVIENKPDNLSLSFSSMLVKENFMEIFPKKHAVFDLIKQAGFPVSIGPISNHCGSLPNYEKHLVLPELQSSTKKLYCHDIIELVYVLFNGHVIGCCSDFRKKFLLGNLNEQNFIDIWNSNECEKRRQDMMYGNLYEIEPCRECSQAWNIMKNRGVEKKKDGA